MCAPLTLGREQILAFRRRAGALDERLPHTPESLRQAAWAGLQDSMPRAAVLSLHARVEDARPTSWEDPAFVQVWGPRYQTYVVPAKDVAVFTLGRLPDAARGLERAEAMAARVRELLGGATAPYEDLGRELGVHPNALRYAAPTGTIAIRWDGARRPTVRLLPRPEVDPLEARLELARRYLHVFGPTTPAAFTKWAGISRQAGIAAFAALDPELTAARTPLGDAWILAADEADLRADPRPPAPARLLPSGDAYFLLDGSDRALLVPDPGRRGELWTPRVWPGGLLLGGEIAGTWRRADTVLKVQPWRRLSPAERDAVTAEAESLPLPGTGGRRIVVRWDD
jgi:Winged helix DNA-binding domain